MAPSLNWDVISSLAGGHVEMDDDAIKRIITEMETVKEEDFQNDSKKFYLLFKSALNMYIKQEDEVDLLLQENVKETVERDTRISDLQREIQDLRSRSRDTFVSASGGGDYLHSENQRLNDVIESYRQQESEMKRDMDMLAQENQSLRMTLDDKDRNSKDIDDENKRLRADLREYRDIMESQQRERLDTKGAMDSELRDKLTEKNNQISELLSQITDLEELNRQLQEGNDQMRDEMQGGQEEMEKLADEYEKMKKVVGGSDLFTENLQQENNDLKLKNGELRRELKLKLDEEDAIVDQVNQKVMEWKTRLAERDSDLREKNATVAALQERITSANLDHDRVKVERLTKQLNEKDEQLKRLQESLQQAVEDLEAQTNIVEDLRKDSKTNREILAYKRQISTLQEKVSRFEEESKEARLLQGRAEDEATDKDRKLSEAVKRISDIETGEYGLSEAVLEIKECKNQIKLRDQNIEELTIHANKLEEKLNDLLEENEEMRERVGDEPRDLSDISQLRKSRALRQQQYRAENQVLLKEIERLEEERIEMKKQIRWQAQSTTQRAVSEGLHPDDVRKVQQLIDDLTRKRGGSPVKPRSSFVRFDDEHQTRNDEVMTNNLHKIETENETLKEQKRVLLSENKSLKNALREVYEELKNSASRDSAEVIHIPSLERLVNAIEVQEVHGTYEPTLHMKAQVDQLTGRNDELRKQLRQSRVEVTNIATENNNLKNKVETYQNEIVTLSKLSEGRGGQMSIKTIPLPDNIDAKHTDVITALNEQLQQVLNNCSKKEVTINELSESLERERRKLNVLRHQNHLVYKEHLEENSSHEKKLKQNEDEKSKLHEKIEMNKTRITELDRLLDTLKCDPDTVKKRLSETTRKISLLRVNEKTLIRRHRALESADEQNQVEMTRLRADIQNMQRNVSERIAYLEQYKEMAAFKIDSLQKAVDGSVPESHLESMNRRFDELTGKYRDLLQKENQFVAKNTKLDNLQAEVKILNEELESLRSELSIEKEKRYTLGELLKQTEAQLDISSSSQDLQQKRKKISNDAVNYELSSILKKVTVLEMKELNERQRAEHSSRMYAQVKSTMTELDNRNQELEVKFAELTKLNLTSQKTERELRDELAAAIPRAVADADRKRITSLEGNEAKLKVRMSQLQDMADIAQNQLKTLSHHQKTRDRELQSLRQQVREFQGQTDDKALVGKLHRQILNLQTHEADSQLKLEKADKTIRKLEAHVLKLEKQIDDKHSQTFHMQMEATSRSRQLKKTIQSLRQQFSGALPLPQQEKFSNAMISLQSDKATIREELRKVRMDREKLEDKVAEANIQKESLMELKKTIEDGKGAEKLTEWCNRMDAIRLQDMKLQRQVVRQNEEIKYLESVTVKQEKTIASLEEDIVEMLKAQEMHQIEWEQRESDLERMLDQFTMQQREVSKRAKKLADVSELIPDPNLPIETQLTEALQTINKQRNTLKDMQAHNKFLQRNVEDHKDKLHDLEGAIISRDKVINEMRMRIPDSSSSPAIKAVKSDIGLREDNTQLKVALEKIEMLKKQIVQKEDSINRHKKLLEEARREQAHSLRNNEHQLSQMQRKLHDKTDSAFNKFRKVALEAMTQKQSAPSADHLKQMGELEDVLKEQDIALETLMSRVRSANEDLVNHKRMLNDSRRNHDMERNKLLEEHDREINRYKVNLQEKNREITQLEKSVEVLKKEVSQQKEANSRAPAVALKNLVQRLKGQLEEKEQKQKKLTSALAELRADLVAQAEDNVKATNNSKTTERAVNNLVEKKIGDIKEQNEELRDKLALVQRGLKQEKHRSNDLQKDKDDLQKERDGKHDVIKRLRSEKDKLNVENERLRDKVHRLANGGTVKFSDNRQPAEKPSEYNTESDAESKHESESGSEKKEVVNEEIVAASEVQPQSSQPRVNVFQQRTESTEVAKLKDEINKLKKELEKKTQPSGKSALEVSKWEIRKQWQGKVDGLKQKLAERDTQLQTAEKQNTSLRETISRLERDKQRRVPIATTTPAESTPNNQSERSDKHKIEELSYRLHGLADENSRLRRESELPRNLVVAEMTTVNENLQRRLESLENELLTSGLRSEKDQSMSQLHRDRENQSNRRLLELSAENTELRFELEQAKIDIPRLKDRVHDQQQYIDLLKAEKREAEQKLDKMKANHYRKAGSGTSGKSIPDLEKTIVLMKKVVERVQRENEALKKAPGVVSNDKMQQLKQENRMLKNRVDEITQQIGGRLSERYESKTVAVDRLMKENERLQRELKKEKNIRERIEVNKNNLQATNDKLVNDLEKSMSMSSPRRKDSKDEQIRNLRSHLQDVNEKQSQLLQENEHLMNQLEIMKGTTFGSDSHRGSSTQELLEARETIIRLKNEKKSAEEMLEVYRQHLQDEPGSSSQHDGRLDKLKLSDENRKLRGKVDALEAKLSRFNDEFFDEIEDLKFNYSEAVKQNVLYEEQIKQLTKSKR